MATTNKSLRIKTNINADSFVNVNLNQTYDTFEILSLKMKSEDVYRLHSANYGVIIGRVLANENFGVPNAKISVFIESEFDDETIASLYPYETTNTKNEKGVRYNLLPDNKVNDCHQVVGTFPNKTYLLDNDTLIEVFDKYYVYTTRTNGAGDYIIMGVPVGQHTIHMDLDLSDCGILSQRPRDFVYKGYTIEQFENPNQFKTSTELDSLTQIFSQNQSVNVIPFWGNADNGETIGITRSDIKIAFKFEPTCVFMGSLVADNASNGISKKCVPTNQMGAMDELTTGEGTIEMIRKTPGGNIEEFQVKGTELIDGNGVWCYQIPMNLDYMMTDEYGNMVPTDDPTKGVPTRARVRFRISMEDAELNTDNYFRAKVLVPHNPLDKVGGGHEDYDYEFGSNTREDSFRDLFWNNVYTVKSYIPRFQKPKNNIRTERFSGIKHCNIYGQNNPMPYNNIRIRLPLEFTLLCMLIKIYIALVTLLNKTIYKIVSVLTSLPFTGEKFDMSVIKNIQYTLISNGFCEDMDNWYFAPGANTIKKYQKGDKPNAADVYLGGSDKNVYLLEERYKSLVGESENGPRREGGMYRVTTGSEERSTDTGQVDFEELNDTTSVDYNNSEDEKVCLTVSTDYLVSCIEMALAQKYKVINFDFYNDWINGVIYMPRWMRVVRRKRSFLWGLIKIRQKTKGCMDDTSIFNKTRYYTQQCALYYSKDENGVYSNITTSNGCTGTKKQRCHKIYGKKNYPIFGGKKNKTTGNGGIVHEHETMLKENVYYFKPCEWGTNNRKTTLFANDLVLLGSLNDCSMYGIPQAFKYLKSSTYIMPTNLALTNMDDDGYLYTTPDGTFCGNNQFYDTEGVKQANPTFNNETKYYSGKKEDEEKLTYGSSPEGSDIVDIFDDTIPLTEAAGIAWNYTGPGQGEKSNDVRESLYMPGGHFLGISCFNSETNIKSCINLQRVCEMGSNISQRREEIREIIETDETGQEYKVKYRYFVPTGLISNDDINGESFRTMFATMNSKRLLCEDNFVDEKTGYPFYRFSYLRNTGFGGELKSRIEEDDFGYWNKQITIEDEYTSLGGNIAKDMNYDEEETGETYTRTWETANYDYYSFRLGLTDMDVNEQERRFLLWTGSDGGTTTTSGSTSGGRTGGGRRSSSGMYQTVRKGVGGKVVGLPQYANSFYFYFGLKDGATAFDEFNKQFFANCETEKVIDTKLTVGIKTEFDACTLLSNVIISGKDAVAPVTINYDAVLEDGSVISGITIENIETNNGYYSVEIEGLERGKYNFRVIDGEGNIAERSVELAGNNEVDASIGTQAFSFTPPTGASASDVSKSGQTFDCGYISISNVSFNGNVISGTPMVTIVDKHGNYWSNSNGTQPESALQFLNITTATSIYDKYEDAEGDTGEDGTILVFVWSASAEYDVYLWNNECEESTYYYYGTYKVDGVLGFDLFLGNREKNFSYRDEMNGWRQNDKWWEDIGDDSDEDNWYKRYFLMKRTVSGESYTNNVFGMNENGVVINTALFGQPEKYNQEINDYVLTTTGTCYEYDRRYQGVVSDTSYISNWPTPPYDRKLFGEMTIDGISVASQPLVSILVSDINETYTSGNIHGFDVSQDVWPDSEIEDFIVLPDSGDKYGYFVGRSDEGRLHYIVLEYTGNTRMFKYEGNRINGKILTIYPVFYFPVMHKEFDAKLNMLDWVNPVIFLDGGSDAEISSFKVKYEEEKFALTVNGINGLTYEGKANFVFKDNYLSGVARRTTGTTDLELPIAEMQFTKTGYLEPYSAKTTCSFSLTEGSPSDMPFEPNLLTISDEIITDMATYITYRNQNNKVVFYNDIDDNTNTYYLVKRANTLPLETLANVTYPFNWTESDKILYLGRFGANSDTLLNVQKEEGTFVQYPGQFVIIEADDNGYRFHYKVNSYTSQSVVKEMQYGGQILNKESLHEDSVISIPEYDITMEKTYQYSNQGSIFNPTEVTPYVNQILNNIGSSVLQIPRFNDELNLNVEDGDYVICLVQSDKINLIRIYPKIINLDTYSGNASEPYLMLIPSGRTGIYT